MLGNLFGGSKSVKMPDPKDYMELVNAQAQANRVDQHSPFGSLTYNTTYNEPLDFDTWSSQNPAKTRRQWVQGGKGEQGSFQDVAVGGGYDDYIKDFDRGVGNTTANFNFSPEGQTLFDKVYDPNAYDNYSGDYMERYSALTAPDREYANERFEQNMFDRGQPVGGEEYGDKYRQTIGDPQSRQDIMAAQSATQMAERARINDYNQLASALGLTTLPVPQTDVIGPANLAMNANIQNVQSQNQSTSNLWNSLGMMGGGWLSSNPFGKKTPGVIG